MSDQNPLEEALEGLYQEHLEPKEDVEESDEEEDVEEVVEDIEEESEEESEDDEEESEDESEEESEDEEDEEDDDKWLEVANNLKTALQKEREKRKEVAQQAEELKEQMAVVASLSDSALAELNRVKEKLKELDLDDLVEVEIPEADKSKLEELARKQQEQMQKQQQELFQNIQQTVSEMVVDYKNIDPKSEVQGVALGNMILGIIAMGGDVETAVKASLEQLNGMLESTAKRVKTSVKKAKKPKRAATKVANRDAVKSRKRQEAIEKGDFDSVISDIVNDLIGE